MKRKIGWFAAAAFVSLACDRDPLQVRDDTNPQYDYSSNSANEGFILFSTDRDDPSTEGICGACEEIYSMSASGDDPFRLTNNKASDSGAAWSLEAKTIAFHTNRAGYPQIFLMNIDGSEQRLLVDLGITTAGIQRGAAFPSWSDDGKQICFNSTLRPREIYVTGIEGGAPTNITNHPSDDLRCDFAPAINKIAFGSTRDGNEEVYIMNADGSDPVRLTEATGADANPDWSPQADRIVFESNRDGNAEIYVMNADGKGQVRLTNYAGQDTKPSWSPKGDKLAFHRRIAGHLEVHTMNADGSDVTRLTQTVAPGFSGFPAWAKGKRNN